MVNVDISPSVVLGVGLIGAGVSLWQIRRVKPWISKDYDVVVSCISLLVGGILIFQGWRLDPLLLFGQLMTTGAAVSFAIEALRLRSEQYETEEKAALQDVLQRKGPGGSGGEGGAFQLPPPDAQALPPWDADGGQQQPSWGAAPQQWQGQPEAGFYDFQQPGASGSYEADQQQQYGGAADGQWYFGSGQYQVADYEVPPPNGPAGDAGAGPGGGFYAAGSGAAPSGSNPSEFVFPASYEDGVGDASQAWPQQRQQQSAQPGQQPPAAGPGRPTSGWDMDDW